MIQDTRLQQSGNSILVDIELHGNQLLIPVYNIDTNIYDILQYTLNQYHTIEDRDNLLNFFQSNKIYVFKEGKFLDALFSNDNFKDSTFKVKSQELQNIKRQFSSNKNGTSISYLSGYPFYKTYNFMPSPAGDLKVIAYKLNPNLKQKYTTFSILEEALNYCRVNIKMIYELYKYAIIDKKDVGLLHSQNCYGTIININGVGIVSPRILGEYGMWIASNYFYIKLNDKDSKNIDLKQKIRSIIGMWKYDKRKQLENFLMEVSKYGEVI